MPEGFKKMSLPNSGTDYMSEISLTKKAFWGPLSL